MLWATKYPDPPPTTTNTHSSQEQYGIEIDSQKSIKLGIQTGNRNKSRSEQPRTLQLLIKMLIRPEVGEAFSLTARDWSRIGTLGTLIGRNSTTLDVDWSRIGALETLIGSRAV